VKNFSHAARGNSIILPHAGEIIRIEKTIVGRNTFHKEFVSASGDSFAALSRNEARDDNPCIRLGVVLSDSTIV
jgi:hypothetical protein